MIDEHLLRRLAERAIDGADMTVQERSWASRMERKGLVLWVQSPRSLGPRKHQGWVAHITDEGRRRVARLDAGLAAPKPATAPSRMEAGSAPADPTLRRVIEREVEETDLNTRSDMTRPIPHWISPRDRHRGGATAQRRRREKTNREIKF